MRSNRHGQRFALVVILSLCALNVYLDWQGKEVPQRRPRSSMDIDREAPKPISEDRVQAPTEPQGDPPTELSTNEGQPTSHLFKGGAVVSTARQGWSSQPGFNQSKYECDDMQPNLLCMDHGKSSDEGAMSVLHGAELVLSAWAHGSFSVKRCLAGCRERAKRQRDGAGCCQTRAAHSKSANSRPWCQWIPETALRAKGIRSIDLVSCLGCQHSHMAATCRFTYDE